MTQWDGGWDSSETYRMPRTGSQIESDPIFGQLVWCPFEEESFRNRAYLLQSEKVSLILLMAPFSSRGTWGALIRRRRWAEIVVTIGYLATTVVTCHHDLTQLYPKNQNNDMVIDEERGVRSEDRSLRRNVRLRRNMIRGNMIFYSSFRGAHQEHCSMAHAYEWNSDSANFQMSRADSAYTQMIMVHALMIFQKLFASISMSSTRSGSASLCWYTFELPHRIRAHHVPRARKNIAKRRINQRFFPRKSSHIAVETHSIISHRAPFEMEKWRKEEKINNNLQLSRNSSIFISSGIIM